jgi:hypothetical protein
MFKVTVEVGDVVIGSYDFNVEQLATPKIDARQVPVGTESGG